jgi:type I restriction enzyme S subunit
MPFMEATATDEQIERFTLRRGDTIFTKDSETADDIARSAYVPEDMPGVVCGYHLSIARPLGATVGAFIKRFLDSAPARAYFQVKANGLTRVGLGQYAVDNVPIALPPPAEQAAIAAFLDRETGKIDALVEEQRRLIALLKEKRQAVISHAVTKGLNPQAPLKPSGIEWLGDIPAHWDVRPLKRALAFLTSGSRGWAEHYADEGAIFIRIGNMTRHSYGLDLDDLQRVSVPPGSESARTLVRPGDVLFSITAFLGSVAVVGDLGEPAYVSQHVALARLKSGLVRPDWVALLTLSSVGKTYLAEQGYGGTKVQLGLDDIACMPILVPPRAEQDQIVGHLEKMTTDFTALIEEAERGITLLQERRAALISAAVTGKIDVRGLVATPGALEAA